MVHDCIKMEIQITKGKVVLKKPTAGARNKAVIAAETSDGIKTSVMMIELLPYCIASHPFGTVPVKQALDALSIEDYDKLIEGLTQMMGNGVDDKKKINSNKQSEQDEQTMS